MSRDLLSPQQRKRLKRNSHPTTGHCYIATEALYHMWGKRRGYLPYVMRTDDENTHWFLKHPLLGTIYDPTREQFKEEPDYSRGRPCGFLTGDKPSKRCLEILRRIKQP